MGVIAFNFDKLLVERKKPIEVPMKVDTGVKIVDLKEDEVALASGRKERVLRFTFSYNIEYQPKQAYIQIDGHLLYHDKAEELDKIVSEWKKTKKFNTALGKVIINNILVRSQVKALVLGQDVGLPPHIRLPMVTSTPKKPNSYIG